MNTVFNQSLSLWTLDVSPNYGLYRCDCQPVHFETCVVPITPLLDIYIMWDSSLVQGFAQELSGEVKTLGIQAEVIDMKDYDPDDQLAEEVRQVQIPISTSVGFKNLMKNIFFFF